MCRDIEEIEASVHEQKRYISDLDKELCKVKLDVDTYESMSCKIGNPDKVDLQIHELRSTLVRTERRMCSVARNIEELEVILQYVRCMQGTTR